MRFINYRQFRIPKRKGGFRVIEQPLGDGLEILQNKLIELEKEPLLKPSYFSHAFMRGRNIVTCARQHFGNRYISRMDISDFFGSVTLNNFMALMHRKNKLTEKQYNTLKSKIAICFKYDPKRNDYYLPQGSPTSPFLSNSYLRFFDWKCAWVCYERGLIYSRYADDLFVSGNKLNKEFYGALSIIKQQLKAIDLKENFKKRKIMKQGKQMNIVGIVVNEKFQIPKKTRKIIRAMLHNSKKNDTPLTMEQKGLINFRDMVDTYDKKLKTNIEICRNIDVARAL